ncbi:Probable 4-hydroxy-3-methylbut-2-enyl diphosphate reductase [Mycobacteroides abscessus]|nr:Probable 4-hydroxy-3-methylbut-2-enyl diphosphate reductase [Mycobacteroides abscessus]
MAAVDMGTPGMVSTAMRTVGPATSKRVLLAEPRGYCAGVDRAVETVERALEKHGAPVYVRHEIVHNRYVVDTLAKAGAIFVDETDEVPEGPSWSSRPTGWRRRSTRRPPNAI